MRILETIAGGFGGASQPRERVREVTATEPLTKGAIEVPDNTPLTDWVEVGKAEVPAAVRKSQLKENS